jgi:hypothetical protein
VNLGGVDSELEQARGGQPSVRASKRRMTLEPKEDGECWSWKSVCGHQRGG